VVDKILATGTIPAKMVITVRTQPDYDPADWSAYETYQYENFIFDYTTRSTVRERMDIGDGLREQVDAELDEAGQDLEPLEGKKVAIRDERGGIVATGFFLPADLAGAESVVGTPEAAAAA